MKQVICIPPAPKLERRIDVGVYCRVITRSTEQINSLANQISELVRFVRHELGWALYDVYIDVMSGSESENRAGFQRMLDDCKSHNISLVICKSISRFGRNTVEMLQSVKMMKECGVNVYFQLENLNTQDSETEHIMTVIEAFREEESKEKSKNIRMGMQMRAAAGTSGFYRRRCYGYKKRDGELEIVPEEAEIVNKIFTMYIEGASIGQIVKHLTSIGIKSPSGKDRWYNRTVDEILSNEKYVGDVILVKSININGMGSKRIKNDGQAAKYRLDQGHQAIISHSMFEAAQQAKKERSNYEVTESGKTRKKKRYMSTYCLQPRIDNDE